jgi:uncharacterized protein YyaL (SSP411 family)
MEQAMAHIAGDSTPNRLIKESSPYLQQHAYNPIDWYPWGEEALAKAKAENKPIFLSIGYSTCYWCHVMARDVFDDEKSAALMNEWFVNIKVDREERPDIDEIYMVARQLMTQEGGWPNNVFLTPDLKPFYAVGTMAADERYGEWNFPKLVKALHDGWIGKRDEVLASSEKSTEAIKHFLHEKSENQNPVPLNVSISDRLLVMLSEQQDKSDGGFFGAPKFPHENFILYLLKHAKRTNNNEALEMARFSLEKMAAGGIYDHIGGGLHRYAVDKAWRVPHFEKMLYNQALFARCFEELYSITGSEYHKDVAEETLRFVTTHLLDASGAFYSAIDAETNAVEGAYYAWNEKELDACLGKEEREFFLQVYGQEYIPVFPGHHAVDGKAIYARKPLPDIAADLGMSYSQLKEKLRPILSKLDSFRTKNHELPHTDTKIIVAWNGLMVDAFALAGQAFSKPEYIEIADKAAHYLLKNARLPNGRLARVVTGGKPMFDAFLEDYAFMMDGLLSLYRATNKEIYLEETLSLAKHADELFYDKEHSSFYYTDGEENLIVRIKQASDMALPSSTAIMVHNFLDLYEITKDIQWKDRASDILGNYSGHMDRTPADYCTRVHALLRYLHM